MWIIIFKEDKMKDTITLRELIKQDACKEGVLWFMDKIECEQRILLRDVKVSVKMLVYMAKQEGHTEYISWLKDHGYAVDDKNEKIAELRNEYQELEKNLITLHVKIKELEK